MSNAEVENLFYAVGRLHFDKKPCEVFAMENDLDDETWARFSERAKIPEAMDRLVALRNLGLIDVQDRMTHAGAALGTKSVPRNPLLFGMLYRMDVVEQIGSGIRRIRQLCREHGVAEPVIDVSEHWVTTTFKRPVIEVEIESETSQVQGTQYVTAQVPDMDRTSTPEVISDSALQRLAANLGDLTAQVTAQVVWHCRVPRTAREIMTLLGLKHRKTFRTNYLQPLLDAEWLEMTIPDKPRSGKQQYRLTDKGQALRDRLTHTE